ncbi:MAG: MarR family winged helix-turn-helix transcriptional regulator [Isosphaeraceae bacterium]
MRRSVLREELKKRLPFATPWEEVLLNLRRTDDQLQAAFARLFKAHGLSDPSYNVLRILRGEGAPLPCLEIAGRMVTRLPDVTRLIDRLESKGLVQRSRTEEDRRVVLIAITAAGLTLLASLDEPVQSLTRELLGHLSHEELDQLNALLVKARRAPGS